jgi:hypothetical protein
VAQQAQWHLTALQQHARRIDPERATLARHIARRRRRRRRLSTRHIFTEQCIAERYIAALSEKKKQRFVRVSNHKLGDFF